MQKTILQITIPVNIKRQPVSTIIQCKGWIQEAAMRMLLNNLDPEVAERPDELNCIWRTGKSRPKFPGAG